MSHALEPPDCAARVARAAAAAPTDRSLTDACAAEVAALSQRSEPLAWARAQYDLAVALRLQAAGEDERAQIGDLGRAREALDRAAQAWNRESSPKDWARSRLEFARVTLASDRLSADPDALQLAGAYLLEISPRFDPQTERGEAADAAALLGCVQLRFGLDVKEEGFVVQAIDAERKALELTGDAADPATQAQAHLRLARALLAAGANERDAHSLEEARTQAQMALALSPAAEALSAPAWRTMGDVELAFLKTSDDPAPYARALADYDKALAISRGVDDAAGAAAALEAGAHARLRRAGQTGDAAEGERALAGYREALAALDPQRLPISWARAERQLGEALEDRGERAKDVARLDEALAAYDKAMGVWTREAWSREWAETQIYRGATLLARGRIDGQSDTLRAADAAFDAALPTINLRTGPGLWALLHQSRAAARMEMAKRNRDRAAADRAVAWLSTDIDALAKDDRPALADRFREILEQAKALRASLPEK